MMILMYVKCFEHVKCYGLLFYYKRKWILDKCTTKQTYQKTIQKFKKIQAPESIGTVSPHKSIRSRIHIYCHEIYH